jgi:hypothetical protein
MELLKNHTYKQSIHLKRKPAMRFKSLNEAIQSVTNPQPEFTQKEYIELLESALESIAEELECDVEDLLEDVQTKERAKETKGMSRAAGKKVQDTERKADSAVEAARDVYGRTAKGDAGHRKALKKTLGAETKAQDKYSSIRSLIGKEKRSKDMFGKGGKIVKKATMKEEQTAQLSPAQRAAAMKDRNSGAHRTPAELKKFAASQSAYVKSQNNRTDSKGKKLDTYDDYQS